LVDSEDKLGERPAPKEDIHLPRRTSMEKFRVIYTGAFPNACAGELMIQKGDSVLYRSGKYAFRSTGSVYFEEDWQEVVEEGELIWVNEQARQEYITWLHMLSPKEREEVERRVKEELESVSVCCGGCL
jgi:hypothetical protein